MIRAEVLRLALVILWTSTRYHRHPLCQYHFWCNHHLVCMYVCMYILITDNQYKSQTSTYHPAILHKHKYALSILLCLQCTHPMTHLRAKPRPQLVKGLFQDWVVLAESPTAVLSWSTICTFYEDSRVQQLRNQLTLTLQIVWASSLFNWLTEYILMAYNISEKWPHIV